MGYVELTKETVALLYNNGMIVNGVRGGLVLGDRHSDLTEGIPMLLIDNGRFYVIGKMEGGEYLVNSIATSKKFDRLEEINNFFQDDDEIASEDIAEVRHINVPSGHFLLVSAAAFRIINRSATKMHLKELDKINEIGQEVFDAQQR